MGARDLPLLDAEAVIADLWRQHFRAPDRTLICDWADSKRYVAKGPERGQWRTARTPYLREPMECMSPASPYERVAMQFATQLGKTEVLYNTIFHRIDTDPMDVMMVQPTLQDAKDHSRTRFAPTAARMPSIAAKLPKVSSRDSANTWQTKDIADGVATLFFSGANSARSLASKPLPLVLCDEIDGYPRDVDGEGDPLLLVSERQSNFWNRKLLLCSTPTIKDFSRIESEYLASDRRRYWVPCPHCGGLQVLVWGAEVEHGIKWLKTAAGEARPETAVYVCQHCAAAIEEHHKTAMLADGSWIAERPGAGGGLVAGFHLNKLYSPLGWKSWSKIVGEWVEAKNEAAKGDTTKLKTFVNTTLAETWEETGDRADESALVRRADDTPLRIVRWGCFVATAGVDLQGDRIEAYAWAWGRGMERQLVDRRVIYGDPAIPEGEPGSPWTELTEWRRTPLQHQSGKPVHLLACAIDTGGHHTQAAYEYVRRHQHAHVLAIKGSSQRGKAILGRPSEVEINHRGKKIPRGVKLWPIGPDTAKAAVYGALRIAQAGPGYVHLSKHLPPEVFEQITSERLVTRYVKGHAVMEWVKPSGKRNEALDCAVYALAAAIYAGIDRWREHDWAKWESRVQARDLFDQAAAAQQSAAPAVLVDGAAASQPARPAANDQTSADPQRHQPAANQPQAEPPEASTTTTVKASAAYMQNVARLRQQMRAQRG